MMNDERELVWYEAEANSPSSNREEMTVTIWRYIRDNWLNGEGEVKTIYNQSYGDEIYSFIPHRPGTHKWLITYQENPDEKCMLITVIEDTGDDDERTVN